MVKNKYSFFERISKLDNRKLAIFLFIIASILYLPTITFDYALDDGLIITDNKFTQQGIKGTKDIFTHDAFEGTLGEGAQYVAGGRYRPFTQFILLFKRVIWISSMDRSSHKYPFLCSTNGHSFLTIKALSVFSPV